MKILRRKNRLFSREAVILSTSIVGLISLGAHAANQVWSGGGADALWSTIADWAGNPTPPGATGGSTTNTDVATFNSAIANTWGNSAVNPVVIDSGRNIGGINFDTAAGNYFIGSTGGNTLLVSSGGTIQILSTLTATNAVITINAPLQIQGTNGTYTLANNSATGTGAGAGTLNVGGGITGTGGGATVLTLSGSNTNANTISGVIADGTAGSVSVIKTGTGTWVLSGANTYSGVTQIDGGILNSTTFADINTPSGIGKGSAAGSAADLVFGGGTLQYTGTSPASTNRLFTIGDGAGLTATIDSSSASPSNTLSFTGTGAIAFGGSGARTLTLTGTNTGNNTFGPVLGNGTGGTTSLVKSGSGTWVLSGANTYTGSTTVNAGTLKAGVASVANVSGAFGLNSAINIANAGATLDITGFDTQIGSLSGFGHLILGGGATLTLVAGFNNTYNGLISGTGGITKSGGSFIIHSNADNTYSGGTRVNSGILQVYADGNNALGTGPVVIGTGTGTGATLHDGIFSGGYINNLSSSAPITINSDGAFTLADTGGTEHVGSIAGSGSITLGATILTIGGDNTNTTFSGVASGTGGLTKVGAGMQTLAGSNTFSGVLKIDGGTLNATRIFNINTASSIGQGSAAGSAADLVFGGGTLQYTNTSTASTNRLFTIGDAAGLTATIDSSATHMTNGLSIDTLSFTGTGAIGFGGSGARTLTLTGTNAGTNTFAPVLGDGTGGATSLVKSGTGTWILSGTNTYTGGTTVSQGTLDYLNTNAKPASGTTTVASGATLGLGVATSGSFFTSANVDSLFAGTLANVSNSTTSNVGIDTTAGNFTYASNVPITTRGLTKLGANTLFLSGTSSYSGVTRIDGGTINATTFANINTASSIGKGSVAGSAADLVFGGGTLQYTGTAPVSTDRLFTLGDDVGLFATIDSSATLASNTLSFTSSGAIVFSGSGGGRTLTLTGTNTGNNIFAPVLGSDSGSTSLIKAGTGTWILSGANTYNGFTDVTAGTLVLTGSINTAGGASLVVRGATAQFTMGNGTLVNVVDEYAGTTTNGTITQSGGTNIFTRLHVGFSGSGGSSSFNLSGGTASGDNIYVADNSTGTYTFMQSGGAVALTTELFVGYGGTGSYTLSGTGTLSAPVENIGRSSPGVGNFNQNGGTNTVSNRIEFGVSTFGGSGTYTLSGGTLQTGSIVLTSGTGTFNFNGGTLQPNSSTMTFMTGLTAANVQAGGAVIDTQGFNITIGQALLHDSSLGATPDGGLTKQGGSGTLTLAGSNTYSGSTRVTAGTLLVSGSISGSAASVTNAGSTLGGTGTVGDVTVNNGAILEGGDGTGPSGALSSGGAISLLDGSVIELSLGTNGVHSGLVRTGGIWAFDSNQAFTFSLFTPTVGTYDNIISGLSGSEAGLATIGTWTITNPDVTGTFSYDGLGNVDVVLSAVPEPGSACLLGLGALLLAGRRRKRRQEG